MIARSDLVIGIDSSTTACKAIAWDREGRQVAEARAPHELLSPRPDWYEQRAEAWWQALCAALRAISSTIGPERIAALAIAHQRETFVPIDERGMPLRNAIVWLDERSRRQVGALDRHIGLTRLHDLTGKGPSTRQTLAKLLWLLENEPSIASQTWKYVDVQAFLVHRLTGGWHTSLPSADPFGALDMRQGVWAAAVLQTLGLRPDQFLDLAAPASPIGEIGSVAASETGLLPGTLVVAGAGDGQAAGLGANITQAGRAYVNLGTALVAGAHLDSYLANTAFRTLCSALPGAFVAESVGGGTFTLTWFVEQFAGDLKAGANSSSVEGLLEAAASELPPGAGGLMVVPYWTSVLNPYWDAQATGIAAGWTGSHGRAHFYRAILEGSLFEHRLAMDGLVRATQTPIHEFILMGGGSRSALWCQMVADISGIRAIRAGTHEATALGAGILAASGAGWYPDVRTAADAMTRTGLEFEPDSAAHPQYNRLYHEVYVDLFPALRRSLDRLTELTHPDAG